ncbi:N-6 DNA methylase [Shewanella mangrovisoli]|uniref:N-6 DNA methylase n=1 Tax=Shewanella mangrovisoli TaxID=2864211 RepID=UPI0035B95A99
MLPQVLVKLNQYYTSDTTSTLLASLLDLSAIRSCLELSAGEGALIDPIKKLNGKIHFTTVDLDPTNSAKLAMLYPDDTHHCGDALDLNLNLQKDSFDLAVCNPPFSTTSIDESARKILTPVFMPFFVYSKKIRVEILFILRNLYLLKESSTLAVIVPELIINSTKLSEFREKLFTEYNLTMLVELDYRAFKKTEAKTFIIFIKKSKNSSLEKDIPLLRIYNNNIYRTNIKIKDLLASTGDFKRNDFIIFRGRNSSKECRVNGEPFHHNYANLNDFSIVNYPCSTNKILALKYAVYGDILIHRVGRNIGTTVILGVESVVVSDCIIVLRFKQEKMKEIFLQKWKLDKDNWLLKNAKGTCAKSITISSISNYINTIFNNNT